MAKKKNKHFEHNHTLVAACGLFVLIAFIFLTTFNVGAGTRVPGHDKPKYDKNNNGYPDVGVTVNGHYTSLYAYDNDGNWYWDLGDGRIQGNVASVDELNENTLTKCDYVVNYRGTFDDNPFMDSGDIQNHINCKGYDDNGTYNYDIVHETNPKYRGNPEFSIWGNWEYHTLTESKVGNLVRPMKAINGN